MTRIKRNLLIAAALILLVAVGVWVLFQMTTHGALLRAESLLFRRLQVARLEKGGAYRFHYVTNRGLGTDGATPEGRFSNQREGQLRFGSFDAQVESSLGLSGIFDPGKWFRNEEINLRDVQELDRTEFVEQLQGMIHRPCARPPL